MKFQLRFVLPFETAFIDAEGEDLADASCSLLGANLERALFVRPDDAGRTDGDTSYFSLIEVRGGDSFVARYFFGGIGRFGGVKPKPNPLQCASIAEVERRLGLESGVLDCDWAGEESREDAWARKMAPYAAAA